MTCWAGILLYMLDLTFRLAQWMNVSIVTGKILANDILSLELSFTKVLSDKAVSSVLFPTPGTLAALNVAQALLVLPACSAFITSMLTRGMIGVNSHPLHAGFWTYFNAKQADRPCKEHAHIVQETELLPNSFIFVSVPSASRAQWHPFTLAYVRNSADPRHPSTVTLNMKPYGRWSQVRCCLLVCAGIKCKASWQRNSLIRVLRSSPLVPLQALVPIEDSDVHARAWVL